MLSKNQTMASPRNCYGEKLVELGAKNPDIVVLDADLSCSTQTCKFAKAYPSITVSGFVIVISSTGKPLNEPTPIVKILTGIVSTFSLNVGKTKIIASSSLLSK